MRAYMLVPKILFVFIVFYLLFFCKLHIKANTKLQSLQYDTIQNRFKSGWGTYDYKSVFSNVLLPDGLSLKLCFKRRSHVNRDNYLSEAYISSNGQKPEMIKHGLHAYNSSCSVLTCEWQGTTFKVVSAVHESELYLLVTPIQIPEVAPSVVLEVGTPWNRKATVTLNANKINVQLPNKNIEVKSSNPIFEDKIPVITSYLSVVFDTPVSFFTGIGIKTIEEVQAIGNNNRQAFVNSTQKYNHLADAYNAMQGVLAWNTIYDASNDRIISPVSRIWNKSFGGHFELFEWDTNFASYMISMENKDLAYANAFDMTKALTTSGFAPNFSGSYGAASYGRSQPPVGTCVFEELYKKFKEKWLLEYVFDDLLIWNIWRETHRKQDGLLSFGSNKVELPLKGDYAAHKWQGALYESGLDNSPMCDSVTFNPNTNMLELLDVGLNSDYILDCNDLSEIATLLEKKEEAKALKNCANNYGKASQKLWDNNVGIFKNTHADLGSFSPRISPANFYPLLAKAVSTQQASKMEQVYLPNDKEFNGQWILSSISNPDSTYTEQRYWRGRIWFPMNFLVYLVTFNSNLQDSKQMIADKSLTLFLENVKINGWIFENYNTISGNVENT